MTRTRWRVLCVVPLALALGSGCEEDRATPTVPASPPPPPPAPPAVPAEATAWIEANALPFDGSHLSLPHDDIEFLREIVGDARIVSLGENTHGARDFFEMKARILRFLVEEMDSDAFAIEATWPESRRLDHYVRTGEGDPHALLVGLHFRTWRTEAVLEMIEWMRAHNEAGGDVGFHGFDRQFSGLALHNVLEYLRELDHETANAVEVRVDCLRRYANDCSDRHPSPRYREETEQYRADCGASLEEARELLLEKQEEYEAAAGEDAFAVALQSLRVATQYHLMFTGGQDRDESMAENTVWIAERPGPESRLVLWAHNNHLAKLPSWAQGFFLREAFGDDMVVVGFSHEGGRFTAVGQGSETCSGLSEFDLEPPPPESCEWYLASASAPRFVLDLRAADTSAAGAAWLGEARPFRSIGCCYDPSSPDRYWSLHRFGADLRLTERFDVLIHHESTRATAILPWRSPCTF